jgi:hypothetical protein
VNAPIILLAALLILLAGFFLFGYGKRFVSTRPRESRVRTVGTVLGLDQLGPFLTDAIGRLITLCERIGSLEERAILEKSLANLQREFSLVVFGEFNAGKSSFINALIGEPLLKTGILPTTNTLNYLCYSEREYVEIIFHNQVKREVTLDELDAYLEQHQKIPDIEHIRFYKKLPR